MNLEATLFHFGLTGEEDLLSQGGKVERFPLLESGLALTEGEKRVEQALLLRLGLEELLAGLAQRVQ